MTVIWLAMGDEPSRPLYTGGEVIFIPRRVDLSIFRAPYIGKYKRAPMQPRLLVVRP